MAGKSEGSGFNVRKRAKKGSTCIHCRQLKLRCDLASVSPGGCTRCVRTGKQCSLDSNFKRTTNRERINQLENELEQMRRQLQASNRESNIGNEVSLYDTTPNQYSVAFEVADSGNHTESNELSAQSLEGVTLPSYEILSLINDFYAKFHPLFPILADLEHFLSNYESNKLLLWTILAIASKESIKYSDLYISLVDPVRKLAGDLYGPQSRDFRTVQALLLLCVWPFPFQQTVNDPSPMYCGLATQLVYQMGLHRPDCQMYWEYDTSKLSPVVELQRKKAWFGCFIINHMISSRLGTPCTIRPNHAIVSEVAKGPSSDLPGTLLSYVHIAYAGSKGLLALGDDLETDTGALKRPLPTVSDFDQNLGIIREALASRWSNIAELFFLHTRLQMYSFVLDEGNCTDLDFVTDSTTSYVIHNKACDTTKHIVGLAGANKQTSCCWPVFAKHSVLCATIMAFRLACLSPSGSNQQKELLRCSKEGVVLIMSWAMFPRDNFSRIATHIEYLIREFEKGPKPKLPRLSIGGVAWRDVGTAPKKPTYRLFIKSRMAANVLYDTVWAGKFASMEGMQHCAHRKQADLPVSEGHEGTMMDTNDDLGDSSLNAALDGDVSLGWSDSYIRDIFEDWDSLVDNV